MRWYYHNEVLGYSLNHAHFVMNDLWHYIHWLFLVKTILNVIYTHVCRLIHMSGNVAMQEICIAVLLKNKLLVLPLSSDITSRIVICYMVNLIWLIFALILHSSFHLQEWQLLTVCLSVLLQTRIFMECSLTNYSKLVWMGAAAYLIIAGASFRNRI